jgi:protoheme ferro-lyase
MANQNTKKRVGIVLFQLGGPDSLAAVEPFLRNLFLDPDIIPLGPLNFIRGPLARYIAKKRTPPVAQRYGQIGLRSAFSPNANVRNLSPLLCRTWNPWP